MITSVLEKMKEYDAKMEAELPVFKFIRQYMTIVSALLLFLRDCGTVREGMWELHLAALDNLCKYFVACDRLRYARMCPLYLAHMYHTMNIQLQKMLLHESNN